MSNQNKNSAFQMIADIEGDIRDIINVNTPDNVPILPVRNLVLFPGVVSPILIGRDSSKIVIQKAEKKGELIGIICQRDPEVDVPLQEDLYKTGVFAKVMKLLTLPNGNITAIVQCHSIGSLRHLLILRVTLKHCLIWILRNGTVSSRQPWTTCAILSTSISM